MIAEHDRIAASGKAQPARAAPMGSHETRAGGGSGKGGGVQAAPGEIANITFSTGVRDVHVPLMGISKVTAVANPAGVTNIAWSLAKGSADVAADTAISASGEITFGAKQTGGTLTVKADQKLPDGGSVQVTQSLRLSSHPASISSTTDLGQAVDAKLYGGVFDHIFASADTIASSIDNVPVGEQFPALPDPTGTSHTLTTPFGQFTLTTKNLAAVPADQLNWFISGGQLGGNRDTVTIDRSLVNIGDFVNSASHRNPTNTLDVGFDVTQELHWFCWQDNAWHKITDVTHRRELRRNSGSPKFAVIVNGEPHEDDYTGHPAIFAARATPAAIPPSQKGAPSTTTITADTLPDSLSGRHALRFTLTSGASLGCKVNATTGVFTAGTQPGAVTVRVSDKVTANPNYDEVVVNIGTPPAAPSAPVAPGNASGTATPQAESDEEGANTP